VHFLNNVSSSIEAVLKPVGVEKAQGVISSLFLKDPNDPQWENDPGTQGYLKFMAAYFPEGNVQDLLNVYGYSAAMTLVHTLKKCGDDLSRENVMKQAANIKDLVLPTSLPGIKLNTSPTDFAPIQQMQLQRFDGKTWVRFGEILGGK